MKDPKKIICALRELERSMRVNTPYAGAIIQADLIRDAADTLEELYDDAVLIALDPCQDE